jgi:plastocyanin
MRSSVLTLTAMLLLWACLPLTFPGATGNNIYVYNFLFSPRLDTATAGRNDSVTVTFRWAAESFGHSVVWDSGPEPLPADQPVTFSGGTYPVSLASGSYTYHCGVHGTEFGMTGQIVIQPFDTPMASRTLRGPHPSPVPALVIQASPEAVQANPRKAARRSRPATS